MAVGQRFWFLQNSLIELYRAVHESLDLDAVALRALKIALAEVGAAGGTIDLLHDVTDRELGAKTAATSGIANNLRAALDSRAFG